MIAGGCGPRGRGGDRSIARRDRSIDPRSPEVRYRRDILEKYHRRMKEEAPYAYKPITPVVQSIEDAAVARRVARLWPLVTVKG